MSGRVLGLEELSGEPLPPLTLSEIERSIHNQLAVHGVLGMACEAGARAATRNTVAAVWLHYQAERALRVAGDHHRAQLEARIAELEAHQNDARQPAALERERCDMRTTEQITIKCGVGEEEVPFVDVEAFPTDEYFEDQVYLAGGGRDVFVVDADGECRVWQVQHKVQSGELTVTRTEKTAVLRGPIAGVDTFTSWPPTEGELRGYIEGLADGLDAADLLDVYELARKRARAGRRPEERAA